MAVLYRHLKPNGEVFYIGIGKDIKRAYNKYRRSAYWKSIVNKYGYEVQIIKKDLTWEDACDLEKILINYHGRRDLGLGTLVNLTDGGEGALGVVYPEEYRQKMSELTKGENHPLYGKKGNLCAWWGKTHTEETKKKMSNSGKGRVFSKEHRDNLKNSALLRNLTGNKNPSSKKLIDLVSKEEYECIKEASKKLNINYQTLSSYLTGHRPNKTNLMYLEEYIKLNIL